MTGGAHRSAFRCVDEAEGLGRKAIAHDVVGRVVRAGAMARLAADLDGDGRARRGVAGAVTCEAAGLGFAGEAIAGQRVAGGLPGREVLGMTGAARRGADPITPLGR